MNSTASALARVVSDLREVLSDDAIAGLSDADRAVVLHDLGEASRLIEAGIVETVATADVDFGHRFGCRGMNELLQRALLTDAPTASKIARAADLVKRDASLVSGERLPARWPALRSALLDGAIGVAGLLAATNPFEYARERVGLEERLWADDALAGCARGLSDAEAESVPGTGTRASEDAEPQATADDLRRLASTLAMILDPDGAEPTDRDAQQGRFLNLGRLHKGSHRLDGRITPEVAAQLQLIFDAFDNPKVGGAPAPGVVFTEASADDAGDEFNADPRNVIDSRTAGQKRHDGLAAALGIAARHDEMPSLGGASPTLVVNVDAKDLAAGTGWATVAGSEAPVPLSVATHTACAGAIQRVLFDEGRIVGITTTDRIFNAHQRRSIVARDRECLIPGCHVPASWCEIHHVTEHSCGGPTSTDNGVPLCWWHHRSLGTSGWEIRMDGGLPQVRGPAWWDPAQRWRTPRLSLPASPARRSVRRI